MNPTKSYLLERYGHKCMLCGANDSNVQWHHIRPRYDFKRNHEQIDDSPQNGALLCVSCHKFLHKWDYYDKVYQALTLKIIHNKERGG